MKGVREVAVKVAGGTIQPGDQVVVLTPRFWNLPGRFYGQLADGRLVVAVNLGKFSRTIAKLETHEVEGVRHA